MRNTRKGFTLIELVIVIGIMGMLGAMGMMAGQQATDAAKASNIAANLEMAGAAMMAYYEDNASTIDVSGASTADVLKGTQAFVKETLTNGSTALTAGSYSVVLSAENDKDAKWFVAYKLLDAEAVTGRKIGAVLENKKTRMNLYKAKDSTTADYEGGTDVYMLVR